MGLPRSRGQERGCRDGAEEQGSWQAGAARARKDGVSPNPCSPSVKSRRLGGSGQGHRLFTASPIQQSLAKEIRGGRVEGLSLTWVPEQRGSATKPPETATDTAVTPSAAAG